MAINFNTHSKAMPQNIAEVYFFNNTSSAITDLEKGQAVHYDPAATLSTAAAILNKNISGGNWGDPDGALSPAIRGRLVVRVASAGDYSFAGIILEDQSSIPANSGRWIKIAQAGGFAQCLIAADVALGARLIWDISDKKFVAVGSTKFFGAGVIIAVEALDVSEDGYMGWCKLLAGDSGDAGGAAGTNMQA